MAAPLDYARPSPATRPGRLAATAIFLATALAGLVLAIIVVDAAEFALRGRRGDGGMSVLLCYAAIFNVLLVVASGRLLWFDHASRIAAAGLLVAIPFLPLAIGAERQRNIGR